MDKKGYYRDRLIPGFHGVMEALKKGHPRIEAIWVVKAKGSGRVREILHEAEGRGVPVQFMDRDELDRLLPGITHQGMAALVEEFRYSDLQSIVQRAAKSPGRGLIVAADHITDEGNLGAIIRTAAFFGAHGLILPKDRSAKVSGTVLKRSSGACAHLPIARVVNLVRALDTLDGKGFWIIGAAGEGPETVHRFDWKRDLVLLLGREDQGLTHIVRERCHQMIRIPGAGTVDSLNVSVACGVILSEIHRQRGEEQKSGSEGRSSI